MAPSWQGQFVAAERGEMALDLRLAHRCECPRIPLRLVVLVDDDGAHAFIEVVAMDDARHYAEFGAHARLEIVSSAAPHLRQRQFEAERRFRAQAYGGLGRPFGIGATRSRFAVERIENA